MDDVTQLVQVIATAVVDVCAGVLPTTTDASGAQAHGTDPDGGAPAWNTRRPGTADSDTL